jgi:uncharacterized membrane protein
MDRKAIKEEAKAKIKGNLWTIWKAVLIIALISAGVNMIISTIFPSTVTPEMLESGTLPSGSSVWQLVSTLAELALMPLTVGLVGYVLKFSRGQNPEIKDIFGFYKNFLPIFVVSLLVGIFVGLGFMVLIIPGIIVALMLSMCNYLLADGRTDIWQIIKDSAEMMKGHKWEYFVFGLSFIGWVLLCCITLGIASIYVVPYMSVANCIWYDKLKALNNK